MNARHPEAESFEHHLYYVRSADGGVFGGLLAGARNIGFEYCGYTIGVPTVGDGVQFVMINSFPRLWQERYRRNGLQAVDPTLRHGMRESRPLVWSRESLESPPEWRTVARAAGFSHGWTKSTHDTGGRFGVLTLARSGEPIGAQELQDKLPTMMWLAQIAHAMLFRVLMARYRHRTRAPLTTREILILRLTAEGRSSLEIADTLGVCERTVVFHIGNAIIKLDAANKTHAVVTAMKLGLLD